LTLIELISWQMSNLQIYNWFQLIMGPSGDVTVREPGSMPSTMCSVSTYSILPDFLQNKTSTYIVEAVNSKFCVSNSIFSVAFDRGRNAIRSLKSLATEPLIGLTRYPISLPLFLVVVLGVFCPILRTVHVRARALGQLLAH